jgi:hypothetical protein
MLRADRAGIAGWILPRPGLNPPGMRVRLVYPEISR